MERVLNLIRCFATQNNQVQFSLDLEPIQVDNAFPPSPGKFTELCVRQSFMKNNYSARNDLKSNMF